jgi:hypothetical protein
LKWIYQLLLLACLAGLTSCQSAGLTNQPGQQENQSANQPQQVTPSGERQTIRTVMNGQPLMVTVPANWQAHTLPDRLIVTESQQSFKDVGRLQGISINIFIPSSSDLPQPGSDASNTALGVLSRVASNSEYIGNAVVSQPHPFMWGDYAAAYYTLNSETDVATLLLSVSFQDVLLVMNVSTPVSEAARIRDLLPDVLHTIEVGRHRLRGLHLDDLPNPLAYPADEVAIGATQER